MKERPILFSGPMVRAILAGTKTQTRRPVKSLLGFGEITEFQPSDTPGYDWIFRDRSMLWNDIWHSELMAACPYGQPGDRLWVREPGRIAGLQRMKAGAWNVHITYTADKHPRIIEFPQRLLQKSRLPLWASLYQGIPNGIFREAARIFLEIVSVRVERLEDITEEGAHAEGFESRAAFLAAFRAMYKLPPDANPWVWVVEFKRAEASA